MVKTGIVINSESWSLLQQEPLYSARFIDSEGSQEIVLVARVEDLESFMEVEPHATLNLTVWCSPQDTWVVALAYLLHCAFAEAKGEIFYLNPRQTSDSEILRKLLRQETLHVIFFSADLSEHLTVGVVQPPQKLAHWQQLVENVNRLLTGEKLAGDFDPDFALAQRDFQAHFNEQDLFY
jgi:hypothetical protein